MSALRWRPGLRLLRVVNEAFRRELAGKGADEAVFFFLHPTAGSGALVVVALEVENTVGQIADQLDLPGDTEAGGLEEGFVNADEDLAGDRTIRFAVIEGDDVGRAGVAEISFIDFGHFGGVDEVDGQFIVVDLEEVREEEFEE